ncbi:MAG: hypothetical protein N3A53_08400, partial [Verrucomicrobiae bacterium]|nr:hypothetical protein [Verrucomicrobiae bacterium]
MVRPSNLSICSISTIATNPRFGKGFRRSAQFAIYLSRKGEFLLQFPFGFWVLPDLSLIHIS